VIEVGVTLAIVGIVVALALPSLQGWQDKVDLRDAVSALSSALVEARARAVTERRTFTVSVDYAAESWRVAPAGGTVRPRGGVDLFADAADPDCPPFSGGEIAFRANGTADAAGYEAVFLRSRSPRVPARYRVKVLGATGRVAVESWTGGAWAPSF